MFGKRKQHQEDAARYQKLADEQAAKARREAREAARYRKSLKSGKSQDPHADRYFIREHEENRRIAEAGARSFRQMAEQQELQARSWF